MVGASELGSGMAQPVSYTVTQPNRLTSLAIGAMSFASVGGLPQSAMTNVAFVSLTSAWRKAPPGSFRAGLKKRSVIER